MGLLKIIIVLIIAFLVTGCTSIKEIRLESLSIVNQEKLEQQYLEKKYLKHHKGGRCITKIKNRWHKTLNVSNKFLKIKFLSKEKVFKNVLEDSKESAYVNLQADGKKLMLVGLCPLVERNNKEYVYTYFYPIKYDYITEYSNEKFNLKTINNLLFSLSTVGYSRWKTNEIVITKEMIDKLEL